jgi:hypothetical protein
MKSNDTALAYFLIKEIMNCFSSKDHFMEEHDIISYVLTELKKNNITENLEKTNLDFNIAYMVFDLLESLALVSRKLENN